MDKKDRYQQIKYVTLMSVAVNLFLSIVKIVVGLLGYSHALVADGIHSLSDLITDYVVLLASKAASHDPDDEHPYGHGRIETLATMGLAIFLALIALGIIIDAVYHIINYNYQLPSISVIVVAFISLIANELLYRITYAVGKCIQSNLVISNAWHSRVDALSSVVVLIGVMGARFSLPIMDHLAAIVVAIFIIKVAIDIAWPSVKELVDTGIDAKTVAKVTALIQSAPGVVAVHELRSRLIAGVIMIDVHVQVDSWLSVSEGHYIADQVYARLAATKLNIVDALVHIDAEDDEDAEGSSRTRLLPARQLIEQQLQRHWYDLPGFNHRQKIVLHYLNGLVHVELYLPIIVLGDEKFEAINQRYQQVIESISYISSVTLYFALSTIN